MAGYCQSSARRLFFQEHYFPIQISPVILNCCLFREESVTPEMYFDSFMNYISKPEANLVEKVLSSSVSVGDNEVLDFLTAFECKKVAMTDNFKDLIIEIAHKEIVQKPRYACDCWSEILLPLKSLITSGDVLFQIYDSLHPTAGKVCKLIKEGPKSRAENESLSHLKRWINGRSINDLTLFENMYWIGCYFGSGNFYLIYVFSWHRSYASVSYMWSSIRASFNL